jgi:hypothetical protein
MAYCLINYAHRQPLQSERDSLGVTVSTHVREVIGSNLVQDTEYPDFSPSSYVPGQKFK